MNLKIANWICLLGLASLIAPGCQRDETDPSSGSVRSHIEQDRQGRAGHDVPLREEAHDPDAEQGKERVVKMNQQELDEFNVELSTAGPGILEITIDLPGHIVLNADRLAHVVPRVPGVVRKVNKRLGDKVKAGEVMAVLESRELADVKAAYLASVERVSLAKASFEREEKLWKKKISAEQEFLEAKKSLAEARIEKRSAEQKLHALGFSEPYLKELPKHPDTAYTRYEIVAPFDGTVIQKHITLGESVKEDSDVFVIADLSTVWVDISVYPKDIMKVREGQKVLITIGDDISPVKGKISYVGPLIGEATRTSLARVVSPNPDGTLRPGMFITAKITVDRMKAPLLVPKTSLQTVDGQTVVFVKTDEGFEPHPVRLGREDALQVEVVDGLKPGQVYVSRGSFTLKAQLSKGAFGDGHGH
ncbi:MAG: efflux RND transporter periplasmic adaptor subunit [Pseudomonadota bacterium]